ncbi:MAG: hypothetical protein U1F76_02125 [Candidatus Competibacteraceae bacterium]
MGLPVDLAPGRIYRHDRFYKDENGKWQIKYLLVLTTSPDGDVVFRLLTSRAHGRPENPRCYLGYPYPGFFLGYLGGELTAKSWLDLRIQDDYDNTAFANDQAAGCLTLIFTLPLVTFCEALDCVAGADDTTRQQERLIRNQRTALNCP